MKTTKYKVGDYVETTHTVSVSDIQHFAEISRDFNPIHTDETYAQKTRFGRRVAHGMFTASFFSGLFGTKLPGDGCLYVSQSLRFRKPVFIDDVVRIRATVLKISLRKKTIEFDTTCWVDTEAVTTGSAEIYVPDL